MQLHVWPMFYALVVWWSTTVLVIYLDGLPRRTFRYSFAGTTLLTLGALWGLAATRDDTTVMGAYLAFTFGTLAWGWQEVSFYMGYVTGPRRVPCPETCGGLRHFGHAIQTSLYHELAVVASAVLVVALTWGGANQIGTWTFMIMWWLHQSAKLNVFFGVRNLNEEFLPEHLQFLRSFLRKKSMNLFFPFSVTVSTIVTVLVFARAFAPGISPFEAVGMTFLGFLLALAILEHWMLVLPLPPTLWSVGLRSRGKLTPAHVEVIAGFLGAGKTTFLRRLLATADPDVRTVVLVNDFGAVGIDSSLLGGRGADVVELPNGCICCSLRTDLQRQIREVVARWSPQRLLIEPSGVAEVTSLLRVLQQPSMEEVVRDLRVYTVVDAGAFLQDYARMPHFFEAQAQLAPVLILNKADLLRPGELETIQTTLHSINPRAQIVQAVYGVVSSGAIESEPVERMVLDAEEEEQEHEVETALGLSSWGAALPGLYDEQALRDVLEATARGAYGDVLRMKGIAQVRRGWVHFDLAGGRTSVAAFAPSAVEQPRAMAIGPTIDGARLEVAFEAARSAVERPLTDDALRPATAS